jgi:hypothetical protein
MPKMPFNALVGPSYALKSKPIDVQITMNWMPVNVGIATSAAQWVLYPTPGYTHLQFRLDGVVYDELPCTQIGHIRGMYYTSTGLLGSSVGFLVAVAAEAVFKIDPPGTDGISPIQRLGTVSNLAGQVSIIDDGFGCIISDNVTIYRLDFKTGLFGSLGTESPLEATSVSFYNGLSICAGKIEGKQSNTFFWSDGYDNATWNALSYASAEGFADPISCVKKSAQNIWFFGIRSFEVWGWTGAKDLPFQRLNGSMGNIGAATPAAVVEIGEQIAFLGSGAIGTRKAYITDGFVPKAISTPALEEEWTTYKAFDDAIAWAYTHEGFTFYVCTWLTDNATWVYCLETGQWHNRATRGASDDSYNRWRVVQGAYAYDKMYCGDLEGTRIYQLSSDVYTEDGVQIVRRRRGPHMTKGQGKVKYNSITIACETGMGDPYGQGSQPQLMLKYSNDGGRTFGTELWKTTGRLGEYKTRLKWLRQGEARDRVYEIFASDPVRWVITGCELDIEDCGVGT